MSSDIIITGARENNLKNINLKIPKNKLVVLTGVSGSGKSTLAFDTLQRECQRLYMESLGQEIDLFSKVKVDKIEGLSPSISINQNNSNNNPRSTVGTLTDITSYLRILFANISKVTCQSCGNCISQAIFNISKSNDNEVQCSACGNNIKLLTKRDFSFNTPEGACQKCSGLGIVSTPDIDKVVDFNKSIIDGAVLEWDAVFTDRYGNSLVNAAKYYGFSLDLNSKIKDYTNEQLTLLLYGVESSEFTKLFPDKKPPKTVPTGKFEGVITNINRRFFEKSTVSSKLNKVMISKECEECNGTKLKLESRTATIDSKTIVEVSSLQLTDLYSWINSLNETLSENEKIVSEELIEKIKEKLLKLIDIGVGYLSLDRTTTTLSGGELQRVRLASILDIGLTGVLYVLDEPTTGLHSRDNIKLINSLRKLRDLGNTVLVVEHDPDFIQMADYIIDMGPGAGKNGGEIIAFGTPKEISNNPNSIIGKYLLNNNKIIKSDDKCTSGYIKILGATKNNLKNVDIDIPIDKLVTFSGVSGSGKSTMLLDIINESALNGNKPINCSKIDGLEKFDNIVVIEQNQIGKSNRSNIATFTDIFSDIRSLFSKLDSAKSLGLSAKDFSFNVAGGRCEKCQGNGIIYIPMGFIEDIQVTCPDCEGKRFKDKVLQVKYNNYSISDILNMTIDEASVLFSDTKSIYSKLDILSEVGLGYLTLGQPTSTLSGGELQRVKISKELGKLKGEKILYLLDEPTTGLHPKDIEKLINILQRLVSKGHSVIVIEHNLDVIRKSDWVIDFGPEGGSLGGNIVASGTPEEIANNTKSITGKCII